MTKRNKLIILITLLTLLLVGIAVTLALALGVGEFRSAARIGYVGNSTSRKWNGEYMSLDGIMQNTMSPKSDTATLFMDFETDSGVLAISVEDIEGNVLFEKDDVGNGSFELEISEKVKVKLDADRHEGKFNIRIE